MPIPTISTDFYSIRSETSEPLPEWTLFESLYSGNADVSLTILRLSIQTPDFNYNILDRRNRSLLHAAAYGDLPLMVGFLLSKEVPINALDDENRSVLHYAAFRAGLPLLQKLMEKNINISAVDNFNRTVLHYSVSNNEANITNYLMTQGASLDYQDNDGLTPLHICALNNNIENLDILLKKGANHAVTDQNSWTPLHWAAYRDFFIIADRLLLNGARINAKTNNGWTPLHLAAYEGNLNTVRQLANFGANLTLTNDKGEDALAIAHRRHHTEVGSYLVLKINTARNKRDITKQTNTIRLSQGSEQNSLESIAFIKNSNFSLENGNKKILNDSEMLSSHLENPIGNFTTNFLLLTFILYLFSGKKTKTKDASMTQGNPQQHNYFFSQLQKGVEKYDAKNSNITHNFKAR
jgi:ankyrin repeat protein